MFNPAKLVRKNVHELVPYSCARDEFEGKEGVFLDANESPYGILNRYPDPYQRELKKMISGLKGIPVEKIFLGNGSDEIIDLTFRIFCEPGADKALTFHPTYGMYRVSAQTNNVELITVPLDENYQIRIDTLRPLISDIKLKLIIICSPNNPTGNLMKRETLEALISDFSGIVLLDEAYIDFAAKKSLADSLDRFPNLIVMQTFSKAYGMAAARIGMAFADPGILGYFNKMKAPYNISIPNQKAVMKRLLNPEQVKIRVKKIIEERIQVAALLEEFPVVKKVYPSDSNFLLVKVTDADSLYKYLIENKIIVRNRSSVAENCLRITIGTAGENKVLIKAFKEYSK